MSDGMPVVTLASGLQVGNFSSPHAFQFTDGSELPACSEERTRRGSITFEEQEIVVEVRPGVSYTDLKITPILNATVEGMLIDAVTAWRDGAVDIVIVPLPVLQAIHKGSFLQIGNAPFRTCRIADRITKINHCDRFCR